MTTIADVRFLKEEVTRVVDALNRHLTKPIQINQKLLERFVIIESGTIGFWCPSIELDEQWLSKPILESLEGEFTRLKGRLEIRIRNLHSRLWQLCDPRNSNQA